MRRLAVTLLAMGVFLASLAASTHVFVDLDSLQTLSNKTLSGSKLAESTVAALPACTNGQMIRVTDSIRGIWLCRGTTWSSLTGYADVRDFATGGTGTSGDPWTGWESSTVTQANVSKPVFFPEGFSRATEQGSNASIVLTGTNIRLFGQGTIVGTGGDYALIYIPSTGSTETVEVSGLTFDGGGSGTFSAENNNMCLKVEKASKSALIKQNSFKNCNEDGIYLGYDASTIVRGARVTYNTFENIGRTAVALISVSDFDVSYNSLNDIDYQGIDVEPDVNTYSAINGTISHNRVTNSGNTAFSATRGAIVVSHKSGASDAVSGRITVDNNIVIGFGSGAGSNLAHAFRVVDAKVVTLSNNMAAATKDRAFDIQSCSDITLSGNTAVGNDYGEVVGAGCSRVTSIGNHLYNNAVDKSWGAATNSVFFNHIGNVAYWTAGQISETGVLSAQRLYATGTALVAGDIALSAGWGSTASVSAISGTDQRFELTITSAGTGQAASPTFTPTYKDGTWGTAPYPLCRRTTGSQPTVEGRVTSRSATAFTLTWDGTPVAAETYSFLCQVMG